MVAWNHQKRWRLNVPTLVVKSATTWQHQNEDNFVYFSVENGSRYFSSANGFLFKITVEFRVIGLESVQKFFAHSSSKNLFKFWTFSKSGLIATCRTFIRIRIRLRNFSNLIIAVGFAFLRYGGGRGGRSWAGGEGGDQSPRRPPDLHLHSYIHVLIVCTLWSLFFFPAT